MTNVDTLNAMQKVQEIIYDYVFIGAGASNSLILLTLIEKGLLKDKQVAIFEHESKANNDKTYCFWADSNESIVLALNPIISHRFTNIQVSQSESQNIDSQPYHYIRSIDLYSHTRKAISTEEISVHSIAVDSIELQNEIYKIHTKSETFKAQLIFDSRPPSFDLIDKKQIYLHQSFFGLHIKCEKDVFQTNSFEMMNFNVEQNEFTQFAYIIPFSSNEALVELTRFGKEKIDLDYASQVLKTFILNAFGDFEILADEVGCIPMTTFINPVSKLSGVLNTGASANLIKPSTGYGFKRMYEFAELVSERIATNELENFNKIQLNSKKRFKFYDKLLLLILMYWPSKGKWIFTRLFEKQSVHTVFSFLDEKSTFIQELKIFASLPILAFLKALFLHFKRENILRYCCVLLITLTYLFLCNWNSQIAEYFSYLILIIGLFLRGIPHGALDHLLSPSKNSSLFAFVLKYISLIVLYFIFWKFLPVLALLVFLLYSSFHFGESELIEVKHTTDSIKTKIKAFIMGLSILSIIIFSHLEESLVIIDQLVDMGESSLSTVNFEFISWVALSLSFSSILIQSFLSKKGTYLGLLFFLLIGIKVPLIMAFGFYFIFQHSSNAWSHLKLGLDLNTKQLFKKSSYYTLGALMIFILILFLGKNIQNFDGLSANFFIFIACISFPHFVLMHIFYKTLFKKVI